MTYRILGKSEKVHRSYAYTYIRNALLAITRHIACLNYAEVNLLLIQI
jgi:hypothetical protein